MAKSITEYVVKKRFFSSRRDVHFNCPKCGASLVAPLDNAGDNESCPHCTDKFVVPGKSERSQLAAASARMKAAAASKSRNSESKQDTRVDYLIVDAYWCESPIKLSAPIKTPLGSRITVVKACVDIEYTIESGEISVGRVRLSRGGGGIMGSDSAINIASDRSGEGWYASRLSPDSALHEAVERDLELDGSRLRRIMMGKYRDAHRESLVKSLAEAINNGSSDDDIAALIKIAGRGNTVTFTYTKPDGDVSVRTVSVDGVSKGSIRARDHEDNKTKSFRIGNTSPNCDGSRLIG